MTNRSIGLLMFLSLSAWACTNSGSGSSDSGGGATSSVTSSATSSATTSTTTSSGSGGAGGMMSSSASGAGGMGTGGTGGAPPAYPPGPYGAAKGDIIADYAFQGFVDATKDNSTLKPIRLGDFYNPTAAGVFPPGSQYGGGTPKPKGMLLIVDVAWVAGSQSAAQGDLPLMYKKYKPMGGEFLNLLLEGPSIGIDATAQDLLNWTTTFSISYPAVIDPTQLLKPVLINVPTYFIIDLRTMKIVDVIVGGLLPSMWTTFESTL